MKIEEYTNNTQILYQVYYFKYKIEKDIKMVDLKNGTYIQDDGTNRIIKFQ